MPAAIGAIAAPIAGSIIGNIAAGGDQDQATAARLAALQQILGVNVPTVEQQRIALQQEQVAGQLNPEMEGTVQQGGSALSGYSTDPRLKDAQMKALLQLQDQGQGGLTASDRMALDNINRSAAGDANAQQGAIMQNMAARGMGGSGMELAARLAAAQGSANRESQQGDSIAGQAQQKALQALMSAGQLSGGMQQQDFGQAAQTAAAQDAISRFNAQNQQNVMGTNTKYANQAQASNLSNKQNVANANTGITNSQETHNKGLYQQQFNDAMQKANAAAGQYGQESNYYGNQANQTRGMWAGIGQGVGSGIAAAGSAPSSGGAGASPKYDYSNADGMGGGITTLSEGGEIPTPEELAVLKKFGKVK